MFISVFLFTSGAGASPSQSSSDQSSGDSNSNTSSSSSLDLTGSSISTLSSHTLNTSPVGAVSNKDQNDNHRPNFGKCISICICVCICINIITTFSHFQNVLFISFVLYL